MKILSIGNSFSQDAQRWLHQIADANGTDLTCVNLYIGGCSLERHWNNIQTGAADYDRELNGGYAEKKISISEALTSGEWDVITLQQASHYSGQPQTYVPYLTLIADYLRRSAPHAKLYIQETWAYEADSDHWAFPMYSCNQTEMFHRLSDAYEMAAKVTDAQLLRVGDLVQKLRELPAFSLDTPQHKITRDGFHLSFLYGRWAAGALWYRVLTDLDPAKNLFVPEQDGVKADPQLLAQIAATIEQLLQDAS